MEEKEITKTDYPWPSRVVNWSFQCVKWGLISLGIAILSNFIPYIPLPFFICTALGFLSIICLGLFVTTFFSALVLSFIALVGMSLHRFRIPRTGLAVGIFIPTLIVFIIETLFIFWAIPEARRSICGNNVRQLNLSLYIYRDEKEYWPDKEKWNDLTTPYLEQEHWNQCPVDKIGPCSYAINENIPADANYLPSDFVVLFESTPGWNHVGGLDDVVTDRHDGCWMSFGDSHIDFIEPEDIPNLRWTVEGEQN